MFEKLMRKIGYVKLRNADELLKDFEQLKQLVKSKTSIIEDLNKIIKSKDGVIDDLNNKLKELNELKSKYEKQLKEYEEQILEHVKNIDTLNENLKTISAELNEYKSVYPPPVKKEIKVYAIIFKQQGLPSDIQFSINVSGRMVTSKPEEDKAIVYLQEGEYDYLVMPIKGYRIEPEKGHIIVDNNHTILINFVKVE